MGGADEDRELWVSDGTAGGTRLAKAGFSSANRLLAVGDDAVYLFSAHADVRGSTVWRAGSAGVIPLELPSAYDTSRCAYATVLGGDLYVSDGERLVRVPAGSTKGELLFSGGWGSPINWLQSAGGRLFLTAFQNGMPGQSVTTLWRYDPQAKVLDRIGAYLEVPALAALGDSVYFAAGSGSTTFGPTRLMRLPNNAVEPQEVAVLGSDQSPAGIVSIAASSNFLYLKVKYDWTNWALWGSDGTRDGTRQITDIWRALSGGKFDHCPCLVVAGDRPYFNKADGDDAELWSVRLSIEVPITKRLFVPFARKP